MSATSLYTVVENVAPLPDGRLVARAAGEPFLR